jgi:hypothetical protein
MGSSSATKAARIRIFLAPGKRDEGSCHGGLPSPGCHNRCHRAHLRFDRFCRCRLRCLEDLLEQLHRGFDPLQFEVIKAMPNQGGGAAQSERQQQGPLVFCSSVSALRSVNSVSWTLLAALHPSTIGIARLETTARQSLMR